MDLILPGEVPLLSSFPCPLGDPLGDPLETASGEGEVDEVRTTGSCLGLLRRRVEMRGGVAAVVAVEVETVVGVVVVGVVVLVVVVLVVVDAFVLVPATAFAPDWLLLVVRAASSAMRASSSFGFTIWVASRRRC